MYHWTEDMIRFMIDATEYGSYHKTLTKLIFPYLSGCQHVCDAGCGLGDLSIQLSPAIPKITAIDIKPQAIHVLEQHCTERGITNIRPLQGDIHQMQPSEPYDGMVFCFFGRSEDILEIIRKQCKGTVVVIKKDYNVHRFSVGKYPTGPDDFNRMRNILQHGSIPFQDQQIALEFGQPFRCFEDIRKFYECYSRDEDPTVLTDEFLQNQVVETGRSDFPLYMPHKRKLGILSFQCEEIMQFIG